jgi:hypothetical protein
MEGEESRVSSPELTAKERFESTIIQFKRTKLALNLFIPCALEL